MISAKEKIAYGFGYFGYFITNAVTGMWLFKYYEDVLGVSSILLGYAYIIFAIWNAINDPLFGVLSDKTSTRFGRRRPYLIFLAPFFSLSFIFLWIPLVGLDMLWIYLTIALIIFDTFYTIIGINYLSLLPEITIDPVERSKLSAISQVFGVIALAIGWTVPIFFYKNVTAMIELAAIFGIFVCLSPLITGLFVKERYKVEVFKLGFLESLKVALSNYSFITFVMFNFLFTTAAYIIIPSFPYFTEYVLGLSKLHGFILILILFFAAAIGFPLVISLNKKYGSKKAVIICLIILEIGLILNFFVNTFEAAILSVIFMGLGVSAPLVLINVMIGDIVDEDAIKVGVRREGAFFGVNALITKPAISLGAFIIAYIHHITGYIEGSPTQPPSAIFGIRSLMSLIPALIILLSIIALMFYPLYGEKLRQIKEKVKELGLGKD